MAVISRIYLVQEFADSTFQIAVMGIKRCPCTGLAVRRRLPSDAIPDPPLLTSKSGGDEARYICVLLRTMHGSTLPPCKS